jgi:hypothetical protein
MSSGFNYRLKLPALPYATNNEQLKAKVNFLDLAPTRILEFKTGEVNKSAYA